MFDGDKGEDYKNSCQVITLTLDDTNRLTALEVWVRSWSRKNRDWYDDNERIEPESRWKEAIPANLGLYINTPHCFQQSCPYDHIHVNAISNHPSSTDFRSFLQRPHFLCRLQHPKVAMSEGQTSLPRTERKPTLIGFATTPAPDTDSSITTTLNAAPAINSVAEPGRHAASKRTMYTHPSSGVIVTVIPTRVPLV